VQRQATSRVTASSVCPRHPQGWGTVRFTATEAADKAINDFHGSQAGCALLLPHHPLPPPATAWLPLREAASMAAVARRSSPHCCARTPFPDPRRRLPSIAAGGPHPDCVPGQEGMRGCCPAMAQQLPGSCSQTQLHPLHGCALRAARRGGWQCIRGRGAAPPHRQPACQRLGCARLFQRGDPLVGVCTRRAVAPISTGPAGRHGASAR
jgi:hypothetical protein